jgi:dTDP-glucose 4,6-dehydratase
MKKRVLLTGCGGSIAAHTMAHIFHNTDWEIVGTDSFRHKGWSDRVSQMMKFHPEWKERLTIVTHDLQAPFSPLMIEKIGHIDYIINMAALSDVQASIEHPEQFIYTNVAVAVNILEYAKKIWNLTPENTIPPEGTAFIQISTDEVYGATKRDERHPEWSAILPSNPYAASKACQEAIAVSYWRTYGVPVIITNTMNNFGEMQQGSKYPAMLQKWIDKGETVTIHGSDDGDIGTRYYLHSRNHSDALVFILNNTTPTHYGKDADRPDRYNITGDKQVSNLELAELTAKLMNKELKYVIEDYHSTRPGHDRHYGLDGTKLKNLGWIAPLTFEESLANTIKWQQENPEWLK